MFFDDLETLSDIELHSLLINNGFPNLPVTETTRNVLIKNLKSNIVKETMKSTKYVNNIQYKGNLICDKVGNYIYFGGNKHILPNCISSKKISCEINNLAESQINKEVSSAPKMDTQPPILASDSDRETNVRRNFSNIINTPKPPRSTLEYSNSSINVETGSQNINFGVVTRLLNFRDETLRQQSVSNQNTYPSEESEKFPLNIFKIRSKYKSVIKTQKSFAQLTSCFNIKFGFRNICISYALNFAFITFFALLIYLYVVLNPDFPNTIHENNTFFNKCGEIDQVYQTSTSFNCIDYIILHNALELNKELIRLLQERAELHYCLDASVPASVKIADFIEYLFLKKSITVNFRKLLRNIKAVEYLIRSNPQWDVGITENEPSTATLDKFVPNQETNFILLKPHLPFKCVLYNKMEHFFLIIGTLTVVALAALFSYFIFRYVQGWKNYRIMAIDHFTADIVNELMYQASLSDISEKRDVILNHLRDKLVPFKKRQLLMWAWNEAVKTLETNDSRIQFGVTIHNGEEFRTMKWTGNSSRDSGYSKKWQSPAFDTTNKILNPPTPCLKIRHMFDSTEIHHPNLKEVIKEAVLEKVGLQCNIHDIQLDTQSCCVYIRCASEIDAGYVHNEINGWWFDKRLLSIKFLRLQRFLSRFPSSVESNNISCCSAKDVSLQDCIKVRRLSFNTKRN